MGNVDWYTLFYSDHSDDVKTFITDFNSSGIVSIPYS
jgi:hypothetical protein